jgi:signal transduction histidine kinase/CheY-like chemotaxis protein
MDQARAGGKTEFSSDSLLAAYHLLLEAVVESGEEGELLQRALAVIAAIPWPWRHRYFAACTPVPDSAKLRLAAFVAGSGGAAPHCGDTDTAACLCGLALVRPERLIRVDTAAEPAGSPWLCAAPGVHLVLPLAARKRVLGVLHVALEPGQTPLEAEQSFLVLVATLLGAELDRRRSEQDHDRLEMQFLQAQKMEAVGRLAGGVAHDFNNILTAITSYADLGLLKLSAESPLRRNFEEILVAADRAALLTQQLLAFSRRQVLAPRRIDLNTVIADLGKTLRRLLGADVQLTLAPGTGLAPIMADPALIEQLVINLAVSAREAMPRGGTIVVTTANTRIEEAYTMSHPAVAPGDYVCLGVEACGPGMNLQYLDLLGGPGRATMEAGTAATLGPAAVNDIIQQGGGHAIVSVSPDAGTGVRVCFPARGADAGGAPPASDAFHLPRGSETILLAEDDDSVRVVMGEVLRDLGYQVLEAREGRGALDSAGAHAGRIDVLLTDVVLPGFGGRELWERISATHPGLRVLYIAGVMDDAVAQNGLAASGAVFLRKPFSPWSLASLLRQVLDAPPVAGPR